MTTPITAAEELELLCRWQQEQDEEAREALCRAHAGFVHQCAHETHVDGRYATGAIDEDDLIQAGFIGLLEAIDRFDPTHGCRLISYAVHYIRQRMQSQLSVAPRIRLPHNQRQVVRSYHRQRNRLAQLQQSTPDPEAVVAMMAVDGLEITETTLAAVDLLHARFVNGDREVGARTSVTQGDRLTIFDLIPTPEEEHLPADADKVLALIDKLGNDRKVILTLHFGLHGEKPRTLEEIGQLFGCTRERVRQIEAQSLELLRQMCANRNLTADLVLNP